MLGKRLKELREKRGLTQKELAQHIHISRDTYAQYEINRRSPDFKTLIYLADFFGVTIDYLLGRNKVELADILDNRDLTITEGGEPLTPNKRDKLIQALKHPDEVGRVNKIPIIGKIAAGLPILAEQNYEGEIEAPENMEGDFALEVQGDSMTGVGILEGDYAICRETQVASSGQIVVAIKDICSEYAEATLKYYMDNNGHPVLRAANPRYPDMPVSDGFRIVGKMVGLLRYGAPHYNEYLYYIGTRDISMEAWDKVIEAAAAAGIKPAFVKDMIEAQVEIAKKLREK